MYCSNPQCGMSVIIYHGNDDHCVDVVFKGTHKCTSETMKADKHHSSQFERLSVAQELKSGIGPTEAYENVAAKIPGSRLTKDGVKQQATRLLKEGIVPKTWPSDMMQCLLLLKETQECEISPDSRNPGYVQVRTVSNMLTRSLAG